MLWFFHCWLSFLGISLLVFHGCQCLFLRHSDTGKCITASEELVYNYTYYALPYYVVMTDNCLDSQAQFRYLGTELLHNIEKDATLVSPVQYRYQSRWAVYKGVAPPAIRYQKSAKNHLKQTAAGSLFFYNETVCAEPSSKYLLRKTYCDKTQQKFTFGSVTAFKAKMEDVHCSPIQLMLVESADYGDFDMQVNFNEEKNIDSQCSQLTNCQVKSLCGGKRSCELTMDSNLLPSKYCPDTSKQIYNKYTCVDVYNTSAITTASNIRLTHHNQGYIEIKDGSIWRKVVENNWDENRHKMLCQHLGFEEITGNNLETRQLASGEVITTGDLICYKKEVNETSCCVHLEPSTTTKTTVVPYVRCKMCNNPLLHNTTTFSDSVFSGSGDSSNKYKNARISKDGWCSSGTGYLLLDLKKEYHITQVVVMADKEQTEWASSYIFKYSNDITYRKSTQISGNQNGYQASRTSLDIYNVRHVKIQSTSDTNFCLRIELCGEVQTPAPVSNIIVSPSQYSAAVTWELPRSVQEYSHITHIIIYLNDQVLKTISRGTQIAINGLLPNTFYVVGIQTQDGSLQKSQIVIEPFRSKEEVRPIVLKILSSSLKKYTYTVSWNKPAQSILKYYINYAVLNGSRNSQTVSKEMTSITIDIEFEKQYSFEISAVTPAGIIGVTSKTWFSHSAPLEIANKMNYSYTVKLKKPKEEQKIRTVALVLLKSKSCSDNLPAPEEVRLQTSPPSEGQDGVAFSAKVFDITEFQADTIEISLQQFKDKRRRKRDAVVVQALAPMSTYRAAQLNTDEAGNELWSYWSEPFMFTGAIPSVNAEESSGQKIQKDLLIPLVIFVLISLLLLGVIIYQRHLIRNNRQSSKTPGQADQKNKSKSEDSNKTMKTVISAADDLCMDDDGAYESPDCVIKGIGKNEAESQRDSARESSTYMPLKDNREPENVYQPLQQPNVYSVEYENPSFTSSKET